MPYCPCSNPDCLRSRQRAADQNVDARPPVESAPGGRTLGPRAVAHLVAEAGRWLSFATERGLPLRYAVEKALGAVALSVRLALQTEDGVGLGGTPGGVADARIGFAVPTKLVGVSAFQPALRALRATRVPAGTPLRLEVDRGRIAAFAGGRLLGLVQPKHGWLTPLVEHGASAVLLRVTGDPERGHTLGLNVAFVGLGEAIRSYERADAPEPRSTMRLVTRPGSGPKPAA